MDYKFANNKTRDTNDQYTSVRSLTDIGELPEKISRPLMNYKTDAALKSARSSLSEKDNSDLLKFGKGGLKSTNNTSTPRVIPQRPQDKYFG